MHTTFLYNIRIPGSQSSNFGVLFNKDEILEITQSNGFTADRKIDGKGALLLPGGIDAHVHFREPGLTHKADMATESHAARAGGVTSFFDMPNTNPPTTTWERLQDKIHLAEKSSLINYAFFIGVTNDNLDEILKIDPSLIPGYKVFMGSSTGNMLVDSDKALKKLFQDAQAPIVVHAEDERIINFCREETILKYKGNPPISAHTQIRPESACMEATTRAIHLARRFRHAHLHIAHVSTAAEVALIKKAKEEGLNITAEVSPHHLLFCTEDYGRLGARIKMNPSIKNNTDREALRNAVKEGVIDIIATDHAPHSLDEKEGNALTAVSGAPMVQFSYAIVLDLFGAEIASKTMAENPAKIFGLPKRGRIEKGFCPELTLAHYKADGYIVEDRDVLSKCGWTPLTGHQLHHYITETIIPDPQQLQFRHY